MDMEEGFTDSQQEIHEHVDEQVEEVANFLNETEGMEEHLPSDNYTVSPIECTEATRPLKSQWVV